MKRKRNKKSSTDLGRPACEWDWPRVGLYIPLGPTVPAACFRQHMQWAKFHRLPDIYSDRCLQLDMARTRACESFLRSDLTHLLMLDSDHNHPLEILPMFARWCVATRGTDKEVEVVGGLNFSRVHPPKACCFIDPENERWDGEDASNHMRGLRKLVDWDGEKIIPVAIAGTGSLLIARTALEKIERPFFGMDYRGVDPTAERAWPGEDVAFAMRCRRAGVQQWVDPSATSPHLAERFIDADSFERQPILEQRD